MRKKEKNEGIGICGTILCTYIIYLIVVPIMISPFTNNLIIVISSPYIAMGITFVICYIIKHNKKKVKSKKAEYTFSSTKQPFYVSIFYKSVVEYNKICKDLDKFTFTEEEYKEWKLEQPKAKPFKLTCRNCGEEIEHYDHCDLCGWAKPRKETKEEEKRSRTIPKAVQREVWRRDNGKCVECKTNELLEYDHIIPFSKGGSNTVRNIQLLCESCNRKKYNKI